MTGGVGKLVFRLEMLGINLVLIVIQAARAVLPATPFLLYAWYDDTHKKAPTTEPDCRVGAENWIPCGELVARRKTK